MDSLTVLMVAIQNQHFTPDLIPTKYRPIYSFFFTVPFKMPHYCYDWLSVQFYSDTPLIVEIFCGVFFYRKLYVLVIPVHPQIMAHTLTPGLAHLKSPTQSLSKGPAVLWQNAAYLEQNPRRLQMTLCKAHSAGQAFRGLGRSVAGGPQTTLPVTSHPNCFAPQAKF